MKSPFSNPRSIAVKASWTSIGLAIGCLCILLVFRQVDLISPFERTRQGLLTGGLHRIGLCVLWSGEALAVLVGVGSLLLLLKQDISSMSSIGIVARSLCGITTGLFGVFVLWLIVGHVVIGF